MTIIRTYVSQIEHRDGSIDYIETKAYNAKEALEQLERQYPDSYVCEPDTYEKYKRGLRRLWWKETFKYNEYRSGEFIYRHKGKKPKGRKNYPKPKYGWHKLRYRIAINWTETYSPPVSDFLIAWTQRLIDTGKVTLTNGNLD